MKLARRSRIEALLHFLDLILFYDEILYDDETSWVWRHRGVLNSIADILKPTPSSVPAMEERLKPRALYLSLGRSYNTAVEAGALYYLALSASLGVPYWPAPERLSFLGQSPVVTFFFPSLVKYMERELGAIVQQALEAMPELLENLTFLGLSTIVLAHSSSRDKIIPTALELRDTKECAALRRWLAEIEKASQQGDIPALGQAMRDAADVVRCVQSGLKIGIHKRNEIELQIGLTPGFVVGEGAVRSVLDRFTPKPLHVTFLRKASQEALRYCNVSWHIRKLFESKSEDDPANPGPQADG
jgi:hypothetical protein